MRLIIYCCIWLLGAFSFQLGASPIYKCVKGEGIVYQQSPCPDGEKLDVRTSKGITQYTPVTPDSYNWADRVNDQFKRKKEREEYLKGKRDNPYLPPKVFGDGKKTRNCVNSSKALDKHQKIMKKGYTAGASNYLRKRKRELESSVREYCQ